MIVLIDLKVDTAIETDARVVSNVYAPFDLPLIFSAASYFVCLFSWFRVIAGGKPRLNIPNTACFQLDLDINCFFVTIRNRNNRS